MVKGKSNPVAKFSKQFNKGGPMRDRKKDDKRGYQKHKKQYKEDDQQTDTTGHTNAAARRPQNYVDPETGKTKTRMVPVHRDVQNEKLNPSDGIKAYIDDFKKSDAPQFKGKSKEKRRQMAIAAKLEAERGPQKEEVNPAIEDKFKKAKTPFMMSKFRKEHPGSRQPKKTPGAKPTEGELHQQRIRKANERILKHGLTSKEKKETQARSKYYSSRD